MAKLTKADVARHLKVSRQTLYEWIQKGRISVGLDGFIDSAEVARVSGSVTQPDVTSGRHHGQEVTSPEGDTTRELIDVLKAQLADAQARERFLQEQVDRLTSIIDRRLLEAPRPQPAAPDQPPLSPEAQRVVRELLRRRPYTDLAAEAPAAPQPLPDDYRGFMRQRVLQALAGHPEGQTRAEIEQAVGAPKRLTDVLQGMVRDGVLVRVARGRYARPAAGEGES